MQVGLAPSAMQALGALRLWSVARTVTAASCLLQCSITLPQLRSVGYVAATADAMLSNLKSTLHTGTQAAQ